MNGISRLRSLALLSLVSALAACGGEGPGTPTEAVCGDGVIVAPEGCDDGNTEDGDGCASDCTIEPGFICGNSPSVCVSGCPEDCSSLDNACTVGICNTETRECEAVPAEDGAACDDGSACTSGDVCTAGVCGGEALDCSGLDEGCSIGICDEATGECVLDVAEEGDACDDRDACTSNDICSGGVCAGEALDCSALDGECGAGICDPESGECVIDLVDDGTACDDGSGCTFDDVCTGGVCGGSDVECPDPGPCGTASCDEETGACVIVPLEDGTACDDGSVCTDDEACLAGACVGTQPDCSSFDGVCTLGICDPITGECGAEALPNDTACDDGSLCTDDETCQAGECVGTQPDCSGFDSGQCGAGVCDPATGACVTANVEDGTTCDDSSLCTVSDVCREGVCAGAPLDCSRLDEPCAAGFCDPATGDCIQDTFDDGASCSDRDVCTTGDACVDGECVGEATTCEELDSACSFGLCDPLSGDCTALPVADGTSCDVDPNDCSVDVCRAGICVPEALPDARSCDTDARDCVNEVCREGACVPELLPDCTACGDGTQVCGAGVCGGIRADLGLTFERAAISSPLTTYGQQDWTTTPSPAFEGSFSARSGRITGGGSSTIAGRFVADQETELSFWYLFDAGDGTFELRLDGELVSALPPTDDWTQETVALPLGGGDVEWTYRRPIGTAPPSGGAYLDDIRVLDVDPCGGDACIDSVYNGASCILCGLAERGTSCDLNPADCIDLSCNGAGSCVAERLGDCETCGVADEDLCMAGVCGGVAGREIFDFDENGSLSDFTIPDGNFFETTSGAFSGTRSILGISDGFTSRVTRTATLLEGGEVSFWYLHAPISEGDTVVSFEVDGVEAAELSTTRAWTQVVLPLDAGTYELGWSITPSRDSGVALLSELFLDDIVITAQDLCTEDTACGIDLYDGESCVICAVDDPICLEP